MRAAVFAATGDGAVGRARPAGDGGVA